MGKRGPKPKPDTEEKVIKSFSFPKSQWDGIKAATPSGERSRLVQTAFQAAIDLPERFQRWKAWRDDLYRRSETLEKYARAWAERWDNFHVQSDFLSLSKDEQVELGRFQEETYALWGHPFIGELMEQARYSESPLNGPVRTDAP